MYYVYIISNSKNTPLYVGVTNNLERRLYEHKNKLNSHSFSTKYNLYKLLFWESTESVESAILREKQLKNWKKEWKVNLIKENNSKLLDLSSLPNFIDPETSSG